MEMAIDEKKTDFDYEKCLFDFFGYHNFRPKQKEIIQTIVEKRMDVCCVMATGYGKNICYQLPAIIMKQPALVISPLISLMEDQRLSLEKRGICACCYNSVLSEKSQLKREIIMGKYFVIYLTPESIMNLKDVLFSLYKEKSFSVIAIDEAHCVSLWGHTFRSSYLQLFNLKEWFPDIPVLALTGTATTVVENDIINVLKLQKPIHFRTGSNRPNLSYYVYQKSNPFSDLTPQIGNESVIIYCQTRKDTEKIAQILIGAGI